VGQEGVIGDSVSIAGSGDDGYFVNLRQDINPARSPPTPANALVIPHVNHVATASTILEEAKNRMREVSANAILLYVLSDELHPVVDRYRLIHVGLGIGGNTDERGQVGSYRFNRPEAAGDFLHIYVWRPVTSQCHSIPSPLTGFPIKDLT
jgi:hypothetical protein